MPTSPEARIVVFGYSEVGYRCLGLLLERGAAVVGVYTHEDDPTEHRWFGSVAELARKHEIPVRVFEDPRNPALLVSLRSLRPDLLFSFYYRHMLPIAALETARLGAFNMHGSLLPKYRGRAPVNWAVLHGETETGATLHHMVARADAGDIVDQEAVPIGPDETAAEVSFHVADAAVRVLARQLEALCAGRAPRIPQDESKASKFGRRRPEDGRIDWKRSAREIVNLVRAVSRPYPGAFTFSSSGKVFIWRARPAREQGVPGTVVSVDPLVVACGDGAVEIVEWTHDGEAETVRPLELGDRLG